MSEVIIRTARLEDADEIVRIDQVSFTKPWNRQTMRTAIEKAQCGEYIALVAEARHSEMSRVPSGQDKSKNPSEPGEILQSSCPEGTPLLQNDSWVLCGFVIAWNVREEGEIATIAVDEPFRGQGIAQRLLEAALHEAARRGAEWMFLEVRPGNIAALHLYEKCSFQKVGLRKNYYRDGDDAVIMRKQTTE